MTRIALVTGVSSGIGRASAAALSEAGFRVFGTVRGNDATLPPSIHPVRMEIREDVSVTKAVAEVVTWTGRLDVLVNNVGATLLGAVEETGVDQAQGLFDTNFFGAVRVTQAVLPIMRTQKAGRVLFVSSVLGFMPAPFMSFYAASKHALEGFAESLDHEVRGLGIRALLVQPTFMRTEIGKSAGTARQRIDDYARARTRMAANVGRAIERGEDPVTVARAVVQAATAPQPRLRYLVGKGAHSIARLRAWVPAGVFDRGLRQGLGLDLGREP